MSYFRYLALIAVLFLAPRPAAGNFITSAEEFAQSSAAAFSWQDAKSRSVKIVLEYREPDETSRRIDLGSGFILAADGLFITAYHVMKYCLAAQRDSSGNSVSIDCSSPGKIRYLAVNEGLEFPIEIVAHLREADSTRGKDSHSPDEIIKQRDFVVGRISAPASHRFSYWSLRDFDPAMIDLNDPAADFTLVPLLPPRRVFISGFPGKQGFVVSEGFLNLTEENRRGYFAADLPVYSPAYLDSQGVPRDTRWGMRVDNHMSGGAVVDSAGYMVGLVVNGDGRTAGILSIENVLATFFSREAEGGAAPALRLDPTGTQLFLKRGREPQAPSQEKSEPEFLSRAPARQLAWALLR